MQIPSLDDFVFLSFVFYYHGDSFVVHRFHDNNEMILDDFHKRLISFSNFTFKLITNKYAFVLGSSKQISLYYIDIIPSLSMTALLTKNIIVMYYLYIVGMYIVYILTLNEKEHFVIFVILTDWKIH